MMSYNIATPHEETMRKQNENSGNPTNFPRRAVLRASAALAGGLAAPVGAAPAADPWDQAKAIIERCSRPLKFREQDFPITAYGAKTCELRTVPGMAAHRKPGTVSTPLEEAPDCYPAIAAAIAACHAAGGGRVLIPAGKWLCRGPMVLLSNVHVHLAAGAHLFFGNNPADYARHGDVDCGPNGKLVISRWQSNDCLNYSPMVYAYGQRNIALTGEDWTSVLDGQGGTPFAEGDHGWWGWAAHKQEGATDIKQQAATNPLNPALEKLAPKMDPALSRQIAGGRDNWRSDHYYLPALSEAGVPTARRVFGVGHFLRPCMIQLIGCTDVLLQGYQVRAAPFWLHNPINCRNVVLRKVDMASLGPNSDGFDPECCDHVLVEGCAFNTGDDCIAIKAGKNNDTQFGSTRNIVIQDSVMNSGHGGVTLGSEMAAGIENIYVQNIEFKNVHWASNPLWTAIRLKTNMNRGGFLRHFYARNLSMPNGVQTTPRFYKPLPGSDVPADTASVGGGAVITFDCDYAPHDDTVRIRPPAVSDVYISGVKMGGAATPQGARSCYQIMVLLGPVPSSYNGPGKPVIPPITNVVISDSDFGQPTNAAQPWYVHNVKGLRLSNVTIADKVYNQEISG
jgi:polygalacturonase